MNCPKCGTKIPTSLGGNYQCPVCDHSINDLVYRKYRSSSTSAEGNSPTNYSEPNNLFGRTGWICPVCGRGLSPDTSECPCYRTKGQITIGTGVTPNIVDGSNYSSYMTPAIDPPIEQGISLEELKEQGRNGVLN